MKRDYKLKRGEPIIKPIKPLFWKQCRFCGQEFKRELGYMIQQETINHFFSTTYCCKDCCKNKDEVREKLKQSMIDRVEVIDRYDK